MGSIAEDDDISDENGNTFKTPKIPDTTRINIFKNITLFFNNGQPEAKQNFPVLIEMLRDFQCRKGYTFPMLLGQLRDFCRKYENSNSPTYIKALMEMNRENDSIHSSMYVQELLLLHLNECGNFEDIFSEVCSPVNGITKIGSRSLDSYQLEEYYKKSLDNFTYYLKHTSTFHVTFPRDVNITHQTSYRFIDYPLRYGESPLMLASRYRRHDTVLLLLRHGATIAGNYNWLKYQSAIEGLLMAPNLIYLEDQDLVNIELCLQYYIRASARINVNRLHALLADGYHALHDKWQQLIPESRYSEPCSLKQSCRVKIRQSINSNRKLPYGIDSLPLPVLLKQYLDLMIH